MPRTRDVYIAIMRAAARGVGLHLTPNECHDLSMDGAIAARACYVAAEQKPPGAGGGSGPVPGWAAIDPYKFGEQ